jgi:hypothetical protein
MTKKLHNILEFYKTTLSINSGTSAFVALILSLQFAFVYFLTFGFLISFLIKEVRYKEEYLFYRNNGVGKVQLWVAVYGVNLLIVGTIVVILNLKL